MYLSATNQGPTATIKSAMSGRVGGGGGGYTFIWVIHTVGVLSIRKIRTNKKKTIVSERRSSEKIAFTDMI